MKHILLLAAVMISSFSYGQTDERISTIDFVQIVDNNKEETLYYYQNNWKVLREMAIAKNYIHSYELLETPTSEEQPFEIMLITTYANQTQYEQREEHFKELIEAKGDLRLMNAKQPGEFRKNLYHKEGVKHLN